MIDATLDLTVEITAADVAGQTVTLKPAEILSLSDVQLALVGGGGVFNDF
jgi:hypothetical protein